VRGVHLAARALSVLFCLGLSACGTDSPPDAPTLQLPFASSSTDSPILFNSVEGVAVGTTGQYAFGLLNAGTANLVVQEVTYAGDAAMSLLPFAQPLPATLPFNGEFVIALQCTPPAEDSYPGAVSIISNAVNYPSAVVYLACVGQAP
jgi:hypothetical protein